MAASAVLNTLSKVRVAESAVSDELKNGYNQDLYNLWIQLGNVDETLVSAQLSADVANLQASQNLLNGLVTRIGQATASLQNVANLVNDAATAIGALANILAAASAGGIL